LLQAVFAKQKESYISQLTKADAAKQELQKQVHDLDEQLVRVANEVSQRQQRAADKGEQLDQQLNLLRKVRCHVLLCTQHATDRCGTATAHSWTEPEGDARMQDPARLTAQWFPHALDMSTGAAYMR
jgi:hypothetical protein